MQKERWIVGVDEVGRGPLAGPVYIGVFAYKKNKSTVFLQGVKDSKQLSGEKRKEWHKQLTNNPEVRYAVARTGAKTIDKKGIQWAIKNAIERALKKIDIEPHLSYILLDGGLHAPKQYIHQSTIIKGDVTEKAISAASIIAKVQRDAYMISLAKKYPLYGFESHKGYGTEYHRAMIAKHGLSSEHRGSYCKNCLSKTVKKIA